MNRKDNNAVVEWGRTTPKDGNLLNQEFTNIYKILNSFGSSLFTKTITESLALVESDIIQNNIIFIKPSAVNITLKIPSGIKEIGRITFILLPTDDGFTASLSVQNTEKIHHNVGAGNMFDYYDLLVENEGVTLMYGNGQWVVEDKKGLPDRYQLGVTDFIGVKDDQLPAGAMLADGRELSRTEYRRLYDVIGITFGAGNSISTFNIPDMRGQFMRGVQDGNLGEKQVDTIQKIIGSFTMRQSQADAHIIELKEGAFYEGGEEEPAAFIRTEAGDFKPIIRNIFDSSRVTRTDEADETRPKNISFTPVIYF